jgi:type IV pilus assembly protein PilM
MKRDQVARALKPLEEAAIPVDTIQLAPLAIYNFICFDRMKLEGPYDPANPPPSTVIISMGTDTTDLVITNGYRVWQRSIPIGGNHFTKALTKELKLTFAKAEHLKRNAMKSENPKAVFQAMRPVFSDLVAEIQRSIGFFTSNNRNAKLGDVVALGNPMKLPGLQRFLAQNLDQDVKLIDQFNHLVGGSATAGPQFKENQLTFGVAYGLCVQALGQAQLRTNLLPEEIITTRLVRAKKPWVVAAAALLLVGLTINYFGHYSSLQSANIEDTAMKSALDGAKRAVEDAGRLESEHTTLTTKFDEITKIGANLQSNVDGRLLWLELLKAIDAALPKDTRPPEERKESAEDVAQRTELHIESMDCEFMADIAPWYGSIQKLYRSSAPEAAPAADAAAADGAAETADGAAVTADGQPVAEDTAAAVDPAADPAAAVDPMAAATDPMADPMAEADPNAAPAATGQSGPGWIIQLRGYHLHNSLPDQKVDLIGDEADQFIINSFFRNLESGTVKLPDGPNGAPVDVPITDLGIRYPVVMTQEKTKSVQYLAEATDEGASISSYPSPVMEGGRGVPTRTGATGEEQPKIWKLRQYDFIIQFAWQPQPRGQRIEKMAKQGEGEAAPSTAAAATETAVPGASL